MRRLGDRTDGGVHILLTCYWDGQLRYILNRAPQRRSRYLGLIGGTLLVAMLAGCVSQGDIQAVRADLIAIERQRRQRDSEVDRRLEALETPGQNPQDMRRELAQTQATTEELRVAVQRLRGSVQELQHSQKSNGGLTATNRDTFATKLAELETRVATLEFRLEPSGSTRPSAQQTPPAPQQTSSSSSAPQPIQSTTTRPAPSAQPDDEADNLYKKALHEYQDGRSEVAIVLFKQFLRQYGTHPLAGHAQYWIGESLYQQKQYEAAIVAFDEVVQKHPKDTKVPAAILKQGFAFAELKDTRNARFFLQKVQKDFPQSPEAGQAAEKLQQLKR